MAESKPQQDLPLALNLGAGGDILEDYHNVDVAGLAGIDQTADLDTMPWPWPDNSFTKVLAKHVLEHLEDPMAAIGEIQRITVPGGIFELWYPIGHTRFEDPTHKHYWNYNTAQAIAGERRHSHEHYDSLTLLRQHVDWRTSPLWTAYVKARLRLSGPGPWLSQIPGLSGHVKAVYRV